jgi:hypothetical protein
MGLWYCHSAQQGTQSAQDADVLFQAIRRDGRLNGLEQVFAEAPMAPRRPTARMPEPKNVFQAD